MNDDILKMSVDRGFTWMEDETLALIKIWSAKEIQIELNTAKRNFSVYERIAKELADVGYSRTAYQCREKIKRLRKEYQVARYCVLHNINQKKPMKYYELVDQVFCEQSQIMDSNDFATSIDNQTNNSVFPDDQDHIQNFDDSSDNIVLPVINLDDEYKAEIKSEESKSNCSNDSAKTVVTNEENKEQDLSENKEITILDDDDAISPWVPNVVLVENEDENKEFSFSCKSPEFNDVPAESNSAIHQHEKVKISRESFNIADDEPMRKKKKKNVKENWFKSLMDKVTEKFINYQESADARLLDHIVHLERERIKKDEAMQKLWIEFEERRQKQERQHDLKMLELFSQFLDQL